MKVFSHFPRGGGSFPHRSGYAVCRIEYLPRDIRFTLKDDIIYAACLGEIGDEVIINSLAEHMYPGEIAGISLLGDGRDLKWKQEGNKITIYTGETKRRKDANVLKIRRNQIYRDN
jgi:hypothetical protein